MQSGLKISRNEDGWTTIENQTRIKAILRVFGDDDKKNVLMALSDIPKTVNDVLAECNIPKTSGYRKINSLINDGLIVANGFGLSDNNKRITSYASIFSDLKIVFIKNKVMVKVYPNKNLEKHSLD